MTQTDDGVTHTFSFAYDSTPRLTSITESASGSSPVAIPAPRTTTFGYDSTGALTSITTPTNVTTTIGYTSDGTHMVAGGDPDSTGLAATTTFDYTTSFGQTPVHDPDSISPYNHGATRYTIDGFDRVDATTDALGNARSTMWASNSDVAMSMDAYSQPTSYAYNTTNSLMSATIPTGAAATATYNGPHTYLPDTGTDPQGNQTRLSYDGPGNMTQMATSSGAVMASAP